MRTIKEVEKVEGETPPLEAGRGDGMSLRSSEPAPTTPMAKLAEADRHLLAIGAEVATLREELVRLRDEAGEQAQLLAEREVVITELSGLLPALEEARVDAVRRAVNASAALTRAEARLSAQAGRLAELERRVATVDAANAAHEEVVAELEARLAEESAKRERTERAHAEVLAYTQAAERSLAEAHARLIGLYGDVGVAARSVKGATAAVHASESPLSRETKRVDPLERERETFEAAFAQHVVGLSELEAELAQAQNECADVRAVATDPPYLAAEQSSLTHPPLVLWVGVMRDATSAAVDALFYGSRSTVGVRRFGDRLHRVRESTVIDARLRRTGKQSRVLPVRAAAREAGRRLVEVLRPGNGDEWAITLRRSARTLRNPRSARYAPAISGARQGGQS